MKSIFSAAPAADTLYIMVFPGQEEERAYDAHE